MTTDAGDTVSARYLVTAVGALSSSNTPPFENIDSFRGETYHTGLWPHEKVDFTGKRVGVIGTGASAVQAIPLIAKEASDLTVFQRTANYIIPANNGPVPEDVKEARLGDYAGIRERIRTSYFGFELNLLEKGALESTDEEIHQELMPRWEEGGFGIWLGSYVDMFFNDEANAKVRKFLHDRIREKVDDPETAELLIPKGYPFGVKRNPLDSGYFETFNEPHVHLVDVKSNPIAEITPTGVTLEDGSEFEFDAIVYATGFDAMTGPLNKIDIRGRDGELLREKWDEGPRTYLGLTSAGFPNLFTITGPQSPSVLSNMPVSIEQHVDLDREDHRRGAGAWRRDHRGDAGGRGRLGRAQPGAGRTDAVRDRRHLVHGCEHPRQAAGVHAQPRASSGRTARSATTSLRTTTRASSSTTSKHGATA